MQIVVASPNIFRRELSSYILGEAGYRVAEVRTAAALFNSLRAQPPVLVLLDYQLDTSEPTLVLAALREFCTAPLVWIAEPARAAPLLLVDTHPADCINWPYQADQLLGCVACLLGRAGAARAAALALRRFATPSE
jgi:DNA-binding response OmpR family regulator